MIGPTYLTGDATAPVGEGNKVIPHVVNNVGAWGAGFVLALSKRWREPEQAYKEWYKRDPKHDKFEMGCNQYVIVADSLVVINMLAQRGLRSSSNPRPLSYEALRVCMNDVATYADAASASIHAPKFGAGLSGGDWGTIAEAIQDLWIARGLEVFIYTPPAATVGKTLFNDARPNPVRYTAACPDCRNNFQLTVEHYPHGENLPTYCPVCGENLPFSPATT